MFFFGIKNKKTFLPKSLMTVLVIKYLSNRTDFTANPIRLSMATALEKASHSDCFDLPQPTYIPVARSISEKK